MNLNTFHISLILGIFSLGACVGTSGNFEASPTPDAAPQQPEIDADIQQPPAVEPVTLSGKVIDYFAANIGGANELVANANLVTDGLSPAKNSTADAEGLFSMDILPASLFYVRVTATDFAPSRNSPTKTLDVDLVQDQYGASLLGVARQYEGAGGLTPIIPDTDAGLIMVRLIKNNGDPALGVPAANIVLALASTPDTPIASAYLVDPQTTDLSPVETTPVSVDDGKGKARAGFVNVAPGDYVITLTIPAGGGGNGGVQTVQAMVAAKGVTFVQTGGNGDGGDGQPAIVLDPNAPLGFSEDIYPILQLVKDGGDGCIGCHDADHALSFAGTPEETLALLNQDAIDPAGVPRIDLANPALSPFVTNPVYEPVPNHPNAFWTVNSNHYKGALAWITQGAALLRADAVLPEL